MKIKKIRLDIGIEKPLKFLHVSDTHLAYADDRDDERKRALAKQRIQLFEGDTGGSRSYLKESIDYARQNCDLLLHTGDLIDFVSYLNLDMAKEFLAGADCFFAAGNHEFSKYVGEAFEDEAYKMDSMPLVQAAFKNNLRFDSRIIGGINLVGMDNVYYHFIEEQFACLRAEVRKGLPILLLMHTPLYTPALYHESMTTRGETNAGIMGCPEDLIKSYTKDRYIQQRPEKFDLELIDYISKEPLIKALFTGHKHFYHESPLKNGKMQYVAGAHFEGDALEIEIR